eukprot:m.411708 g.411708  ORF g.411708 m.411708 type:complete len:245 (+) comp21248_c0_seq38:859-1593(+)
MCAWVASAPSVPKFIAYRLLLTLASVPTFSAFRASLADLADRTTDEYTLINQWVETLCAVVRIAALAMVGMVTPRQCLRLSAVMRAIACGIFAMGTTETLKSGDRIPIPWHRLKNPFASLVLYTQTPALTSVAWMDVLVSLPAYNNTLSMLRRQRFQWGMREESRLALMSQLCGLASPFIVVPMLRTCGKRGLPSSIQPFSTARFVDTWSYWDLYVMGWCGFQSCHSCTLKENFFLSFDFFNGR